MKLYYAPGAHSLAAHIVLRETERRFDLERVDLPSRRTASGVDFRLIHPTGHVPVLELDEAGFELLLESPAILCYLADLVPEKRLAPASGTFARYHLQEWLAFLATELHEPFCLLEHPELPDSLHRALDDRIAAACSFIQDSLAQRSYLLGQTFGVADASAFVMLRWARASRFDLERWPNLGAYEQRIAQRPSVRAALAAEGLARPALRRTA